MLQASSFSPTTSPLRRVPGAKNTDKALITAQGHLDEVQELKRGGTKITGGALGRAVFGCSVVPLNQGAACGAGELWGGMTATRSSCQTACAQQLVPSSLPHVTDTMCLARCPHLTLRGGRHTHCGRPAPGHCGGPASGRGRVQPRVQGAKGLALSVHMKPGLCT